MITYEPFWKTLERSKESTYTLIKVHNIASSTIDRLRKNKPLNTTTINDLCFILNCRVEDIMAYTASADDQLIFWCGTETPNIQLQHFFLAVILWIYYFPVRTYSLWFRARWHSPGYSPAVTAACHPQSSLPPCAPDKHGSLTGSAQASVYNHSNSWQRTKAGREESP